jgi:High potential iron-sulfur protein
MKTVREVVVSRRSAIKFGVAVLAAGVAGRTAAQQKIAQNLVQYQESPKNGQKCSDCLQFEAPDKCKVVDGKISPNGWCVAFVAKPK